MHELLHHVFEYRDLHARRDLLRLPLTVEQTQRIAALEDLLGCRDQRRPAAFDERMDRRRFDRVDVRELATVEITGLREHVWIRNLSGGGLEIAPVPALDRGDLVVVSVTDPDTGARVHLPAQTVWRSGEAAGLSFVGVPARG